MGNSCLETSCGCDGGSGSVLVMVVPVVVPGIDPMAVELLWIAGDID